MFDRETWLFINSFAPLLAALGPVAVVLVSIYLYRRASRPDIRVSTSITSEPLPGKLFFRISVVNHSRKAVVKSIVWWSRGFGRRRQGWFVPPRNIYSYSTEFPCDLDFAQEAHFFFPIETFHDHGKSLLEHVIVRDSKFPRRVALVLERLTIRRLRVGVITNTGQYFGAPLDPQMRGAILVCIAMEEARSALQQISNPEAD